MSSYKYNTHLCFNFVPYRQLLFKRNIKKPNDTNNIIADKR